MLGRIPPFGNFGAHSCQSGNGARFAKIIQKTATVGNHFLMSTLEAEPTVGVRTVYWALQIVSVDSALV